MSRVKKTALALAVLFSLEFLSLGLFTNGTFSWTDQYVPPLLKAASHTDARAVKLDSPAKPDGRFILERHRELTPRSGGFLITKENTEVFLQSFIVSAAFFQDHSSSQSVSLHFQIRSRYLIFLRSRPKRRFTPAMKNHPLLVVLDIFL